MIEFFKTIFSKKSSDNEIIKILGSRRFFLQSLFLLAILYFAFLWTYPLIDRDEGFHAGAAAEMLRKGNWIVPTINDENFFHKPIMIYWLTIPSLKIFGHNEFAARFPSALCMFLLVIFFRKLLIKITTNEVFANISTLIMAFSPIYVIVARTALVDGILLLFVTVALLSFFIATEQNTSSDRKWYLLFWLCLGLAFLTKGPVAPAVILPTVVAYCVLQKKTLHVIRRSMIPTGILIFLALNFWYLIMIYRLGDAYLESFFVKQIFKRGTKVLVSRGGGPFYYIVVIILGGIPFSSIFIPSFWMPLKTKCEIRNSDPLLRLCLFSSLSVLITYLVFSSAATKLPHYILPAFPWLSIITVYFFHCLKYYEAPHKWVITTAHFLTVLLPLFATFAILLFPIFVSEVFNIALSNMRPDSGEYALPMTVPRSVYFIFPLGLITFYLALHPLKILKSGKPYKALSSMLTGAMILSFVGLIYGSIGINAIALEGKRMFVELGKRASSDAMLTTYGLWKQSMSFYTQRKLIRYRYKSDADIKSLEEILKQPVPVYVMTRTRILQKLSTIDSFVPIKQYDGYFLGGNKAAKAEFKEAENTK